MNIHLVKFAFDLYNILLEFSHIMLDIWVTPFGTLVDGLEADGHTAIAPLIRDLLAVLGVSEDTSLLPFVFVYGLLVYFIVMIVKAFKV